MAATVVVGQGLVDGGVERQQGAEAERVGLGVVLTVVEGDQAEGLATGQGDLSQLGPGHALGVGGELLSAFEQRVDAHVVVPSSSVPVRVLPDHSAAHADADAHGGEAVADLGALGERVRELGHQAHTGGGQRVAHGDRAAVRVDPRVVVGDAVVLEQGEHLDREGLVDLEGLDVVDGQAGLGQRLLGRRDRTCAHHLGLDAGEREGHEAHPDRQAELARGLLVGEQRGGGAVVDAGRVARGHPTVGAERSLQAGQRLHAGAGAHGLVGGGQAPAGLGAARGDGHQVGLDLAGLVGRDGLGLRAHGVGVGALLGDRRVAVVQVLGGVAHGERLGVDDLLRDDPRVGIDALAHRVAAHVLDAAGDDHVVGTEGDAGRGGRHRRHGTGAHAVDGEAGDALRQTCEQRGGAADGQALVADLGGRGDRDLVDPLGRQRRVASHELADALDDEVIGARLGVLALGLAERGAHAVDEDDLSQLTGHVISW